MIDLDFTYSGRTTVEPAEGHNEHNCSTDYDISDWVYYTQLTGTFTSNQHGTFSVARRGEAFQVGAGANVTSMGNVFGASGWFTATGGDGFWDRGDINILLSAACTPSSAPSSAVTYAWSTGATTPSITVSNPGTFTVTVTDCAGCTATDQVVVTEPSVDGGSITVGPVSYTHLTLPTKA